MGDFDLFDSERRKDRAERTRAAQDAMAKEEARDEATRARVRQEIIQSTREMNRREYEAYGVQPPRLDAEGYPAVSLALLLRLGWRIEILQDGTRQLVK